jgi:RHS repeat-associated protein
VKSTDANGLSVINEYYSDGKVAKKYIDGQPKSTITFEYDLYGNLSKMIDPDLGTITYTYTGFGELETETNNKNLVTSYEYDNLGRVTTRTDDKETRWTYDISENGVGMVASVSIGVGLPDSSPTHDQTVIYSYDNLSRAIKVDEIIENTTYTTSTSYDIYGRADQVIYPSTNYTIKNHYNEFGFFDKVIQTSDGKVLWQATAYNEKGQLLQSTAGTSLTTTKEYNPLNGSLTAIRTGTLQNFEYEFDALGNLNWRKDMNRNMKEGFEYDNLNRLSNVYWNNSTVPKLTMNYDDIGNITYKSDVGNYTYDADKLHKLISIDNKPVTISDLSQYTEYSWFDKVTKVTLKNNAGQTNAELLLTYGVDRQRIKQVITQNGVTNTRIYVGGLYEKFTEGTTTEEIHYISGGDGLVDIYTKTNTGASLSFVLKDHLGSIQVLVKEDNTIDKEFSYDPWGGRRDPATWAYLSNISGTNINRGFTGHEQLDIFALINMNGRMYDPVLGYFTTPDPVIQFDDYTQGLNRYAYCLNNPLSMIDPSGHNAWNIIIPLATIAVGIAVTYFTGGAAGIATTNEVLKAALFLQAALCGGAAASFTGSLLTSIANGCSFQESLVNVFFGTIIGTCSAVVTFGIGTAFEPAKTSVWGYMGKAAAHGVKNGLFSFVQGGKFEQGFFSGAASSLSSGIDVGSSMGAQVALGAVVGGTVEEIGGGKFANGAVTGAFTVLFNDALHSLQSLVTKGIELNGYIKDYFSDRLPKGVKLTWKYWSKSYGLTDWDAKTVYIPKSMAESDPCEMIYDCVDHELVHVNDYANGNAQKWVNLYGTNYQEAIMEYRAYSKNFDYSSTFRGGFINGRINQYTFYYALQVAKYDFLPKTYYNK